MRGDLSMTIDPNDSMIPDPDYDWALALCSDNSTAAREDCGDSGDLPDIPDIDDSY
jgi:hypothetical protein